MKNYLRTVLGILTLSMLSVASFAQEGQALSPWEKGTLEIHHINTGLGDSTFFILPDGTTLLVDACDARDMPRPEGFLPPPRPDASRSPGEWIGRYVRARLPEEAQGKMDYALMTHFHPDHLSGIADVHAVVPIAKLMDRSWPETRRMPGAYREMMKQYEAFRTDYAAAGGQVERFVAGRKNQIALLRDPKQYPDFEVRNVAVSGHTWTGVDEASTTAWEGGEPGQENNNSAAFVMRYGKFSYFTGGDLLARIEKILAPVLSPVDIHVANHHGSEASEPFLKALQPRVHIVQVWDAIQPRWHALDRMQSEAIYPGPRDIFVTNGQWPERAYHILEGPHKFPEEVAQPFLDQIAKLAAHQGHIVVRVPPGGATYEMLMIEDADESFRVKSVHGPYVSKGP